MNEDDVDYIEALQQKMRIHLETFLATEVLGWEIRDDNPGAWYAPEFDMCLYAVGQSSKFEENWVPTIIFNQALYIWNEMNLAADITFDPNTIENSNFRYVIKLKVDGSTGWGNTIQEAWCSVIGTRHGWKYEDD